MTRRIGRVALRVREHDEAIDFFVGAPGIKLPRDDGTRIGWDRLVIATGAEPLLPPLKGAHFPNVGVFKSGSDLRSRIDHISKGMKKAVVVGPGTVVFAVGMRPSVELFKDGPLAMGRDGIIVNDKMETSLPGVYAVGDCVQFSSALTGSPIPGKPATNTVPMAKVLAANLCGADRSYGEFYNGGATKIGDLYAEGSGITAAFAAKNGIPTISGIAALTTAFRIMPNAKEIALKLVASRETGRILGGQVVGGEPVTDKVDVISTMLRSKWTVEDVLDFGYSSQPWQSFFPADNVFVAAAEKLSASM